MPTEIKEQAGGIVQDSWNHNIVVVRNQIGKIVLPKGSRNEHELPIENALREIWEETGVSAFSHADTALQYLGVLERPGFTAEKTNAPSVLKRIDMFHLLTPATELNPRADDIDWAAWVSLDTAYEILTWEQEVAFLHDSIAALRSSA